MNRIFLLIITAVFINPGIASAQMVSGVITDATNSEAIPGATIIVKGTNTGTISDINGNFSINAAHGDTLVCSFVGMLAMEVAVGSRTEFTIQLEPEVFGISEIVVTALGIKREEKALGYAIQDVSGEEISEAKELDVVNALAGKVAGVNITKGSGSLGGGGSRIVIRGETSLAGNNDPLFIIDGLRGNANDVSSDDIASISVLKGPAAAALYGSEGGAGVIIITTKTGKKNDGIGVSINTGYTWQSPLVLPDYQNQFGQGKSGIYHYINGVRPEDDTDLNWGPAFEGQSVSQFNGYNTWQAYPENVKDFYQTGSVQQSNVALDGGNEQGTFRFAYTNIIEKGIVPNTGAKSNRIDFNAGWNFTEKLNVRANVKFLRSNTPNNRSYDPRFEPRSLDFNALKDYWVPGLEDKQQLKYRDSENNPYFLLYENLKGKNHNRFVGRLTVNYKFSDHLSLAANYGYNNTHEESFEQKAKSTVGVNNTEGAFNTRFNINENQMADFLLSYNRQIGLYKIQLSAGGNHDRSDNRSLTANVDKLLLPDVYSLENQAEFPTAKNTLSQKETNSLYAFLNFEYRSYVFVDLTGRNDWASTMSESNNSFFYPSAALSFVASEALRLPKKLVPFWKIRASVAEVGNAIRAPYWVASSGKYEWTKPGPDGVAGVTPTSDSVASNIKPERTLGLEVGTDARFVNNRLGIDITYYNSVTRNQIMALETSRTSGGNERLFHNEGVVRNYGVELTLNALPVKQINGLNWQVQLNWSYDRAILKEVTQRQTTAVGGHLYIANEEDEPVGNFYGKGYSRSPNGDMLFSKSGDTRRGEEKILGNYNPDWMASLTNTIHYRGVGLNILFDYRRGADFYSKTLYKLNIKGLSAETTLNNRENIVPVGVVEDGNGRFRPLTIEDMGGQGQSGEQYWANMMDEEIPEAVMQNGTYLKLREMRLSYNLPQAWLQKTFIQKATIALVGRNLYVWTKVKHVDPEAFSNASDKNDFGGNIKVPGYENSGVPSLKSYGFNISFNF